MNLVWLLFSFNGRINRVQFWLGWLGACVGGIVLQFVLGTTLMSMSDPTQIFSSFSFSFMLQWALMSWVGLALQVKRYHDRGRSGLWTLLPVLPTIMVMFSIFSVFGAVAAAAWRGAAIDLNAVMVSAMASAGVWLMILCLVYLFVFVDIGCMPGKPEANRYGNPPGGGFTGGGAPASGAPMSEVKIPGKPSRASVQPAPVGSTLASAESAIDRAIAQSKQRAAAPAPAMAPRPAMAAAQPSGGLRPATPGTFGRRPTR